jgi:tetratricopeptide (TPR) repeat protein
MHGPHACSHERGTRARRASRWRVQAKNLGNESFKAADYPKAIEHYTEALRRGPPGQWEEADKCVSNRAACYTKLGAMPEGATVAGSCAAPCLACFGGIVQCA